MNLRELSADTKLNANELREIVDSKIKLGQQLKDRLEVFNGIEGAIKIQRKINQEIKFLDKIKNSGQLKLHHLLCSNLVHFECLINTLYNSKNIKHIDYPISLPDRKSPLRIDIVCDNGCTWIKVIARNPKSLSDSAYGRSGYGTKTILDQAAEFIQTADDNKCLFKPPTVIFEFAHRIDDDLAAELKEIGVQISHKNEFCNQSTDTINTTTSSTSSSSSSSSCTNSDCNYLSNFDAIKNVDRVNLDVTTLLAYVSAMTNGSASWQYAEQILTEQAICERQKPVKVTLDKIFNGKELICCETAASSFAEITAMLGGKNEKFRADAFMNRVKVLPDVEIPNELQKLNIGGKIKARSLKIFSFGIVNKAITVTANEGFIRSARMQGIDIPVFIHDARPLSEQKEAKAISLSC